MEPTTGPYFYRAFGEWICSDFELWAGLAQTPQESPTIFVRLAGSAKPVDEGYAAFGDDEATICWPRVGTASIRRGRVLELRPDPRADRQALSLLVTGPMLATVLHQRGLLVLHGSCVADSGGSLCFIGRSGAGKSTLATAFLRQGKALLSDGMTVLGRDDHGRPVALRGPPQVRLWPDAAASLGWDVTKLARVAPEHDKFMVPQPGSGASVTTHLTHIFAIEAGDPVASERLQGSSALLTLLRNHYFSSYVSHLSSEHVLRRCAELVPHVPVSSLRRGSTLQDVTGVLNLIESENGFVSATRVGPGESAARASCEGRS